MNIAFGGCECLNDILRELSILLHADIAPEYAPSRKGDIMHSHADISKANMLIGYDPQWSFKQGLAQTIDWYCNN
jgi:nucleoside-diphosphate-sugar epimerase